MLTRFITNVIETMLSVVTNNWSALSSALHFQKRCPNNNTDLTFR